MKTAFIQIIIRGLRIDTQRHSSEIEMAQAADLERRLCADTLLRAVVEFGPCAREGFAGLMFSPSGGVSRYDHQI